MRDSKLSAVMSMAALAAASVPTAPGYGQRLRKLMDAPRRAKRYPTMLVSSPEAIAEHNRNVKTRQVLRRKSRPWKLAARWDAE